MSLFSPVPRVFTLIVWGLAGALIICVLAQSLFLPALLGVVLTVYLVVRRQDLVNGVGAFAIGTGLGLLMLGALANGGGEAPFLRLIPLILIAGGGAWLWFRHHSQSDMSTPSE